MSMKWQEMVDYFMMGKRVEKASALTMRDYTNVLRRFKEWLDREYKSEEVNKQILRNYVNFLMNECVQFQNNPHKKQAERKVGLSSTSINIHISYLKAFFNYLCNEEIIDKSPMDGIKKLKVDSDKVSSLSADEVKRVLQQIDVSTYAGNRDNCIMMLMLDTGIRIGELLKLKVGDFDYKGCSVVVRSEVAKTRKLRVLPISPIVSKLIHKHLLQRNGEWLCDELFTTFDGSVLNISSFRCRLKTYAEGAGIEKRVYPYLMRHTFSMLYLNNGDAFSLQKMLGHTSMQMTRRYVNLKEGDLKERHVVNSPVDNIFGGDKRGKRIRKIVK